MKSIFSLLFSVLLAFSGFSQINLQSGLVGYFDLNNNVLDGSVTALNGTNNGAVATTGFDGTPNGAMSFNETQSDFVDAGTSMRGITDQVSISFWYKTTSTGYDHMVSKYDWVVDAGFHVSMYYGQILLQGRDGSGNGITGLTTATNYNDGQWHHVVAIVDQNTWQAYVDCQLVIDVTTTTISPTLITTRPLTFGKYDQGSSGDYQYYNGDLDEIRIYNRPLTTDEVCTLCGSASISNSLVGYFDLNNNVLDGSVTALNGTNNGAVATTGFDGTPNGAMSFNETQSDFVDAGTSMRGITDQVSISFWYKTTSTGYDHMVSKYDWVVDAGFHVSMYYGQILLQGRDGSGNGITGLTTATNYNDGQWHHVVAIVDQNTWQAYVDCQLVIDVTTTTVSPTLITTRPLTFGKYDQGSSGDYQYYNGDLDEIRIYNRPLTESEMCHLCHSSVLMGVNNELSLENNVVIFPNPTAEVINISGLSVNNFKVAIVSITGQYVRNVQNSTSINISDLSKGIYMLQIMNTEGNLIYVTKFIKD